jgi:acyl-CoA synthetase (AMP-forming)/AMP-acid ligase II
LFVVGRLKDLLIVRGLKHYPQDLELTIERQHLALRPGCTAVFALEPDDSERIAVAAEIDPRRLNVTRTADFSTSSFLARVGSQTISSLISAIRQAVAETHGIQLHTITLLKPGTLPKTSSGKIRHRDCAQALSGGLLDELVRWVEPNVIYSPGPTMLRAEV